MTLTRDARDCEHDVIVAWRYASGPMEGHVAMWACRECRLRFTWEATGKVPLPHPTFLDLDAEAAP